MGEPPLESADPQGCLLWIDKPRIKKKKKKHPQYFGRWLPEESEQFRFLRASHLANLKGSVGLTFSQSLRTLQCGLLFPSIWLRGLSYLYLDFLTLVEWLLFLINLWSQFRHSLPKWHMMCVMLKVLSVVHHSSSVTFFPWLSPRPLFYSDVLKSSLRFSVWPDLVPPVWPLDPLQVLLSFLPAQPSVCEEFRSLRFSV
jgi:hypothetical protein